MGSPRWADISPCPSTHIPPDSLTCQAQVASWHEVEMGGGVPHMMLSQPSLAIQLHWIEKTGGDPPGDHPSILPLL